MIGDLHTAGLVSREGAIDWLCLPRFDSGSVFSALLGSAEHGTWRIAPAADYEVRRSYRGDSLILQTEFSTGSGSVRIIDFMPPRDEDPTVVRVVEGIGGRVDLAMELIFRFDYGATVPWVRRVDDALVAVAGPDSVWLFADVPIEGRDLTSVAEFSVSEGETLTFRMVWLPSHLTDRPDPPDALDCLDSTESWWRTWVQGCTYRGRWRAPVVRSLITLKALTYQPTGGILAAPTTSLPEIIGGARNWDYRFSWVRDATFSLYALLSNGYTSEAVAWRDWLLRAVAGDMDQLRVMYGPAGERWLVESELEWLPGFEESSPVRIGNAAADQFQLDIYGELMDSMHQARLHDIEPDDNAWNLQRVLMDALESKWSDPDDGIWEFRGPRRHFTHSKVMAWVGFDRAVKAVERFALDGPVDSWRRARREIRDQILDRGYDRDLGAFTQYYGSSSMDASLLMIPLVGFLPATDGRVQGTMNAIQRDLDNHGLLMRYRDDGPDVDGFSDGEGAFLACTLWLADNLTLCGRREEAERLFRRLVGLSNDVGLLSEEYDPIEQRFLGNFPQALTHLSLVNAALNLSREMGPGKHRSLS